MATPSRRRTLLTASAAALSALALIALTGSGASATAPTASAASTRAVQSPRDVVGGHGALWIYSSFDPTRTGWTADGAGTSESSPLFAGVVALADQLAGHRLGQVDRLLYRLYGHRDTGLVDVTTGDTGPNGYTAGPGYDQATGLGTVDATRLVHALAGRP